MTKALWLIALLCLLASPAKAWFEQADGGQPGEYLDELSGGARGLSLGLAQAAFEGQANLLYSNPAGIAGIWWKEASFSFLPLFAQSQYASLSFAAPVGGKYAVGVMLNRLTSGDAEKTNSLGESIGTFSDQETALIVGAGARITQRLSYGLSLKMVSQDIDTLSVKGFGADAGLLYRTAPGHVWGLSLINAVQPVLGPDRFPMTVKAGFTHGLIKNLLWHGQLSAVNPLKSEMVSRWYTGLEFNSPEWLFWRAGANQKQFSAGFGIATRQVDIDYAFVYHPLETLHSVSMNVRYGYPSTDAEARAIEKIEEMQREKEDLKESAKKAAEDIRFERARLEKEKTLTLKFLNAKEEYDGKRYASAKEKLEEILKADPSREEARALLDDIKSRLNSENVARRLQYARESYKKGAFSEAMGHAAFVLELQADNQEARMIDCLSRSQKYLAEKQFKEAKGELIEAIKIDPGNVEASQLLKRVQNILDVYGGQ